MKVKSLNKIITLTLITVTISSANIPDDINPTENKTLTSVETIYETMSTTQLQEEIEKHSKNGEVTFAMGMELMKRWTNS